MEHGANINAECSNALQAAAAYRGNKSMAEFLLEHRADFHAQGGRYGNALQAAEEGGSDKIVKLLLDHGAKQTERPITIISLESLKEEAEEKE